MSIIENEPVKKLGGNGQFDEIDKIIRAHKNKNRSTNNNRSFLFCRVGKKKIKNNDSFFFFFNNAWCEASAKYA